MPTIELTDGERDGWLRVCAIREAMHIAISYGCADPGAVVALICNETNSRGIPAWEVPPEILGMPNPFTIPIDRIADASTFTPEGLRYLYKKNRQRNEEP